MSRIVVGLSGGVDSAVAALLLRQAGHQLTAVFMKNWDDDDDQTHCPAKQDLQDARSVCERLDIGLQTVSFSAEYWNRVFRHFLDEYQAGRTPNPDILCNQEIKFRAFLDYALDQGADAIATGHYARLEKNGTTRLLRAADDRKDQTYFLHTLNQSQLEHSLFPIGHLEKTVVRELAAQAGFQNHDKKDSTGICFIGERKFRDFLERYLPRQPGEIRTLDDADHRPSPGADVLYHWSAGGTGDRRKKRVGRQPVVCAGKDPGSNILRVVQGVNHPALFNRRLRTGRLHWIAGSAPRLPLACTARIRYRQSDQPCLVTGAPEGAGIVEFREPQRAVTPGQSVVFYDGEVCLGGGVIEAAI